MDQKTKKSLYVEGEERFGSLGSRMYSFSKIIPTMRNFYKFTLGDMKKMEFENVLDIGSGNGYILVELGKLIPKFAGIGIDPSPQMVSVSSAKATKYGLSDRIKFEIGSSRQIPHDGKFDLIYTAMSFHHWKEREESIHGIMERLNENGKFLVYEVTDNGSFSRKFVKSHLMDANTFKTIAGKEGLDIELREENGFIRCMFIKN